jgi:hypothetical protein
MGFRTRNWLFFSLELSVAIPSWGMVGQKKHARSSCCHPLDQVIDLYCTFDESFSFPFISLFGNVAYFLCSQVWMVCLARFVCGAGTSVYLITSVFILRTTEEESRSEQFAWMNAVCDINYCLKVYFD